MRGGAKLSTDLVVSWIRLWEKMLEWKPVSQMVDSRGEGEQTSVLKQKFGASLQLGDAELCQ